MNRITRVAGSSFVRVSWVLGLVLASLIAADAADAGLRWSGRVTIDAGANPDRIACPSVFQCTTVDDLAGAVTFDPRAPRRNRTRAYWVGINGYASIACPSTSQCTAIDIGQNPVDTPPGQEPVFHGHEVTFDPRSPQRPPFVTIEDEDPGSPYGDPVDIACPSTVQCTVVDSQGYEITFNPRLPAIPNPVRIDTGPNSSFDNVTCPSTVQCTAADFAGREVTFNPQFPQSHSSWTLEHDYYPALDVACASSAQCTALDASGRLITFNPQIPQTTNRTATNFIFHGGPIVCPSRQLCVAASDEWADVFNPHAPGRPMRRRREITPWVVSSIACPSATQCTATDSGGGEITARPARHHH